MVRINIVIARAPPKRTISIDNIESTDTIAYLKELVLNAEDIPDYCQHYVFAGKQLEEDKTLSYYNIKEGTTIHMVSITWILNNNRNETNWSYIPINFTKNEENCLKITIFNGRR